MGQAQGSGFDIGTPVRVIVGVCSAASVMTPCCVTIQYGGMPNFHPCILLFTRMRNSMLHAYLREQRNVDFMITFWKFGGEEL